MGVKLGPKHQSDPKPPVQRVRRERSVHAPTSIWLTVAFAFFTTGAAVALAAVTVSDHAPATRPELWIVTTACAVLTITCLVASWDVNRSRKVRVIAVEEEDVAADLGADV